MHNLWWFFTTKLKKYFFFNFKRLKKPSFNLDTKTATPLNLIKELKTYFSIFNILYYL